MKTKFYQKRPLFVVGALVVVSILVASISTLTEMKNYDELLDTDTMNVYSGGSFLGSFTEPQELMDTYSGSVGVGVIDLSDIGLKKTDFIELYTLEFIKNDDVISKIEMLTLRSGNGFNEQKVVDYFREFDGNYVVMHEDGYFFIFGQQFYSNLSRIFDSMGIIDMQV